MEGWKGGSILGWMNGRINGNSELEWKPPHLIIRPQLINLISRLRVRSRIVN